MHGLGKKNISKCSIHKLELSFQVVVCVCLCVSATLILSGKYIKPNLDCWAIMADSSLIRDMYHCLGGSLYCSYQGGNYFIKITNF